MELLGFYNMMVILFFIFYIVTIVNLKNIFPSLRVGARLDDLNDIFEKRYD